ncbi:MAG: arsenate reductase ArsC [FCB group bacterium]|nr:arsenate reductase ArsC [FCB group bacterium]
MAEGLARTLNWRAHSAGVEPGFAVNPRAIAVMAEIGIDISGQIPKNLDNLLTEYYDYVVTLCDHARETCPNFTGKAGRVLHQGFPDPFEMRGTEEEILKVYRKSRDDIYRWLKIFTRDNLESARLNN